MYISLSIEITLYRIEKNTYNVHRIKNILFSKRLLKIHPTSIS